MLSILIPLYNAEKTIGKTIESCLSQPYADIEVIVVDDHSTDKSLAIAREYECENIHVYVNPLEGGNSARNYAFQMSRGEYVKFLDADDYCSDLMFEKQMKKIVEEGTNDTIVFSPVRMFYTDDKQWLIPPHSIHKDYSPGIELLVDIWRGKGWCVPHCHLMHRSLVERAGLWDERIIKNQDGEFFGRIYAKADKALCVKEEYAVWNIYESGVHARMFRENVESAIDSLAQTSKLLLDYRNDEEIHELCDYKFGYFLYKNYAKCPQMLFYFEEVTTRLGISPKFPTQLKFSILKNIFGWKFALKMINVI